MKKEATFITKLNQHVTVKQYTSRTGVHTYYFLTDEGVFCPTSLRHLSQWLSEIYLPLPSDSEYHFLNCFTVHKSYYSVKTFINRSFYNDISFRAFDSAFRDCVQVGVYTHAQHKQLGLCDHDLLDLNSIEGVNFYEFMKQYIKYCFAQLDAC